MTNAEHIVAIDIDDTPQDNFILPKKKNHEA